jgi:aconitase A
VVSQVYSPLGNNGINIDNDKSLTFNLKLIKDLSKFLEVIAGPDRPHENV